MQYPVPAKFPLQNRSARFRPAFSLIEMMVAVGILVVIILAVGVMFKTASRSIGISQATLELMSNVRSVQQNLEHDIAGIDKNAFLVIRSRLVNNRRFDQISFLSYGTFPDHTGNNTTAASSGFIMPLSANAAHVWYGHVVLESNNPPAGANYLPSNQNTKVLLTQLPSGISDLDFILGRHTTLLISSTGPGSSTSAIQFSQGDSVQYYPSIDYLTPPVMAASSETAADITSSRIDVCSSTPGQVLQEDINAVMTGSGRSAHTTYEADHYCYRFAALKSVYDAESSASGASSLILNAYFRMNPIMLQGCPSFAIDWTDSANPSTTTGIKWYGLSDNTISAGAISGSPTGVPVTPRGDVTIEPVAPTNGDGYQAIFSFDNRAKWPKALRFRYHVADPLNRLPQGRDFVQVINLPN